MASCFAAQGEGRTFGQYLQELGLVEQMPDVEPAPRPKKSAKELIAWAQALTDKAKAGESS